MAQFLEPSIAYVVATYSGKEHVSNGELSSTVLTLNMDQLLLLLETKKSRGIRSLITHVVIVVPFVQPENMLDGYYKFEAWSPRFSELGVQLVILPYKGANKHHSYDQWIQGCLCEKVKTASHFILIEDDYCLDATNLTADVDLLEVYKRKFPDGIGYLASWAPRENICGYHAAISNGMVSRKSWEQFPDPLASFYAKQGSCPQLLFSALFTSGPNPLGLEDFRDRFSCLFWNSHRKRIEDYGDKVQSHVFMPVQQLLSPAQPLTAVCFYGAFNMFHVSSLRPRVYDDLFLVVYEQPPFVLDNAKVVLITDNLPSAIRYNERRQDYERAKFIEIGSQIIRFSGVKYTNVIFERFNEITPDTYLLSANYVSERGVTRSITECRDRKQILTLFGNVFDNFAVPDFDIREGDLVFFIPSVINLNHSTMSIFTPPERFNQTVEQVKSIKKQVPGAKIFLLDQFSLDLTQLLEIHKLVDYVILFVNDPECQKYTFSNKSAGEIYATLFFSKLMRKYRFDALIKFGGRYKLLDSFDEQILRATKIVAAITPPNLSWSGHGLCESILYTIPRAFLDTFIERLPEMFIDIEHTLYKMFTAGDVQDISCINAIGISAAGVYNRI